MNALQIGTALVAGAAYFLLMFIVAFAAGTVRVLMVVPRVGEINALLLELPLILTTSWLASYWLANRFVIPPALSPRLVMGLGAFALLMIAEASMSVLLFGQSLTGHFAAWLQPAKQIGLLGQAMFAFIPTLQSVPGFGGRTKS